MVDFLLNIRSELVWDLDEFRKTFHVMGASPPTPPQGAPSPGPGYFWIESHDPNPNSLRMLSTKSTISQKLKITHEVKNPFQNIAHLLRLRIFWSACHQLGQGPTSIAVEHNSVVASTRLKKNLLQ